MSIQKHSNENLWELKSQCDIISKDKNFFFHVPLKTCNTWVVFKTCERLRIWPTENFSLFSSYSFWALFLCFWDFVLRRDIGKERSPTWKLCEWGHISIFEPWSYLDLTVTPCISQMTTLQCFRNCIPKGPLSDRRKAGAGRISHIVSSCHMPGAVQVWLLLRWWDSALYEGIAL